MRWLRRAKEAITGPPEGSHGRRNIDGSYFAIWMCPDGHGAVAGPDTPPTAYCWSCVFTRVKSVEGTAWRRATAQEAHDFLIELEGFQLYSRRGFTMMSEVAHTKPNPDAISRHYARRAGSHAF